MPSARQRLEKILDKETTDYVRILASWHCFRCGRFLPPPYSSLQTSHFIGRSHRRTRWYLDNLDAACPECHPILEHLKRPGQWYYEWKITQLGGRFYQLLALGQFITKYSEPELRHLLKEVRHQKKESQALHAPGDSPGRVRL